MADINSIAKVAVDAYRGSVEKYTVGQSMELLHKALVEANGGNTTLNYKNIRDGKCTGLFALVEEILSRTVIEGLQGDEYFNQLVDFRNIALGDQNVFLVEDTDMLIVADAAEGTQGVRRQRLGGVTETAIPTQLKVIKIYEELNRVLAGRVDFNTFITKVGEAFRRKLLDDIYTLWSTATAGDFGGTTFFPAAGAYDEDEIIELINHVEAAAGGRQATIIGTKKGVRNLSPSILGQGVDSQSDLYNMGYFGKFYGTPVIVTPQRHKVGTTDFILPDNIITIIATGEKPLKFVYEGDSVMIMGDPSNNADLTQEYFYGDRYGCGIILAGGNSGIGRYEIQ